MLINHPKIFSQNWYKLSSSSIKHSISFIVSNRWHNDAIIYITCSGQRQKITNLKLPFIESSPPYMLTEKSLYFSVTLFHDNARKISYFSVGTWLQKQVMCWCFTFSVNSNIYWPKNELQDIYKTDRREYEKSIIEKEWNLPITYLQSNQADSKSLHNKIFDYEIFPISQSRYDELTQV